MIIVRILAKKTRTIPFTSIAQESLLTHHRTPLISRIPPMITKLLTRTWWGMYDWSLPTWQNQEDKIENSNFHYTQSIDSQFSLVFLQLLQVNWLEQHSPFDRHHTDVSPFYIVALQGAGAPNSNLILTCWKAITIIANSELHIQYNYTSVLLSFW